MGTINSLCLVLVLLHVSWSFCSSDQLCLPDQRDALLHFKNSIFVPPIDYSYYKYNYNPRTDTWNKSIDCCSWDGVECDDLTGYVTGVNLTRSCLSGFLSANNSLFHLHNLQWLDLSFNNLLYGSLLENNSSSLFHLHRLQRLNLAGNQFDGAISSELFTQLVSLTHLDLSYNHFSGLIPYEISLLSSLVSLDLDYSRLRFDGQGFDMLATNLTKLANLGLSGVDMSDVALTSFRNLPSSLQDLSLYHCKLHGEFPSQVFQLPNLKNIYLGRNGNLTGHLPNTNLSSSLELLDLSDCGFRGSIPASFGNLTQIISIDLSGNQFEGEITDDFGNLTKLTSLSFSSCSFSGPLPTTMFNLPQITFLDLSDNHLEGPLPNHVGELPFLKYLVLSNNSLSGGVPSWPFTRPSLLGLDLSFNKLASPIDRIQMPSFLQYVDLSSNYFDGSIPDSVFHLVNLTGLYLSSNNLSGSIPDSIFDLVNLNSLDLSSNNFSGSIPDSIFDLVSLTSLDLSSNNLSGSIPDSIFDLVNLTSLDLSSNNLSGVVKSNMLSKLSRLEYLDVSNNSLLSLSTSSNIDVNYSFPSLSTVLFSGCSLRQFPSFFRTSEMLVELDLSNNKIIGGIFKWEAQGWENLRVLNLSYNSLTSLQQFPGKKLEILDLHSNLLQGPILSTLDQPSLRVFIISENKLTGNIPPPICNSSALFLLDLSDNNLSGAIPECLGNFSSNLQFMGLKMNNLYGKIPDSFCNNHTGFYWLSHLYLNDNQLEGLVPPSLANCSYLHLLNLGNNKLTDRFPHWLASLPMLDVLILKSNKFHGLLPHSIASPMFSALRILDLSRNEFSGSLPPKLFRNLQAMVYKPRKSYSHLAIDEGHSGSGNPDMEYYQLSVNVTTKRLELQLTKTVDIFVSMDLSNNQFCGPIPEEVGLLISLQMLNFSHNNFTGHIPSSFRNLVALESLDLSSNQLGSRIPSQMTDLTFLEVLNLSENRLVGPIPHGKQFDTFDNDSYSGNLGLCGLPLSKQCSNRGGDEPPAPSVVKDEGSAAIPFFWKVVMMGYGSGVVLGVSLGYIVFTTGRPWWFVRMVERDWQPKFTKWMRGNIPKKKLARARCIRHQVA